LSTNFSNMQDENHSSLNILPNIVRSLPNTVSFSKTRKRSTRVSYQDNDQIHKFDKEFWNNFEEYLNNIYRKSSVKCRYLYAKQYYQILLKGNAQPLIILSTSKRLQVMKSLSVLSKFMGCYDNWKNIKDRYQLKWSNGNNSLEVFQTIVNYEINYDSMIRWVKDTCSQIPRYYVNILIYCTLTGLRAGEECKSLSLVENNQDNYLNKETIILEHFRHPDIFIRRTKQVFISFVNYDIINLAKDSIEYSYNALRCYLKTRKLQMNMNYCRKIFATFMRNNGIEQEIIDLVQGRIPKSVFVRHYYKPDLSRFEKVRSLLDNLYNQLI
jgi:hypothetical protein